MRLLLNRFYSEIATVCAIVTHSVLRSSIFLQHHPSEVLRDAKAAKSLYSFALSGLSAYIHIYMPYLRDKEEADENGMTALHIASRDGHMGCVYRLVQGGANTFAQDKDV